MSQPQSSADKSNHDPSSTSSPEVTDVSTEQGPSSPESYQAMDLDPNELFATWAEQDQSYIAPKPRRKSVADYPAFLWLILVFSCFLTWQTWPAMQAVIDEDQFTDCGKVIQRVDDQFKKDHPFQHQEQCLLEGFVQHLNSFVIGYQENSKHENPFEKNRGLSYVVKLAGDNVFAILPAHQPWVESYRVNQGSLVGLEIKAKGLMIQPRLAKTYQYLEKELRSLFFIKPQYDIWFFDLTYSPWDYKMPLTTFVLSPLITLLALWGLRRQYRLRQSRDIEMNHVLTQASAEDYKNFNRSIEDDELQQWPQDQSLEEDKDS
jgi:hypothetical protein